MSDSFTNKTNSNDTSNEENTVIIKSDSLLCDIQAFVEKSPTCYYFYLWFNPLGLSPDMGETKIKSCWICNRQKAPSELNTDEMKDGKAPMMPAGFVAHDPDGIELDESKLSIVWFEEGTSAALLCDEEILCVIPEWSGFKNFHGYSKYAKGDGPFGWEMNKDTQQNVTARVEWAKMLRDTFTKDEKSAHAWISHQYSGAAEFVGTHENDFNIANKTDKQLGKITFPPKMVISGLRDGVVYGVTVGVSLPAMPEVTMHVSVTPQNSQRIELGFAAVEAQRELCNTMYKNLSMCASVPWQQLTFLAHGHTIPLYDIDGFAAILFVNARYIRGLEAPEYPDFMNSSLVNMLWTVPITKAEYDFIVNNNMRSLMDKAIDPTRIHIFDGKSKFTL